MIRQQINLHQPIFRKQRALFSFSILIRICAIWAVGLGVVYAAAVWRDGVEARELSRLQVTRDTASTRLQDLTARTSDPERSKKLADELARLRTEQQQKEGVLALLASGDLGDTTGFAPQIDALAERRLSGVWLTHIGLSAGGRDVDLRGVASEEGLIPEYLDRLADAQGAVPGFKGTRFAAVSLDRKAGSAEVTFELGSQAGKAPR